MSDQHERLLDILAKSDTWLTAATLASQLGVTSRSVRSYATAVKSLAHPLEVIESSTAGYRLNRERYSTYRLGRGRQQNGADRPLNRVHHLVRRLGDAPEGLDISLLADSLFVSDSTIEADLRKVKVILDESNLSLTRRGNLVSLGGTEANLRRLLSRIFRDEEAQGFLELESIQREFGSENLGHFKTELIAMLDEHGYFVNEYGINNVLLHVAIVVARTAKDAGHPGDPLRPPAPDIRTDIPTELATLIRRHFAVALDPPDLNYLALLLTTRVITPGAAGADPTVIDQRLEEDLTAVRMIVTRVAEEYLVDLDDEDFILRLALHVRNLIARANDKSYSRNPMSRSIKTAYPMIYELAVFIASEIQRTESITIHDDEISYIALHVGSHLERQAKREERVTCAIVIPNYYDLHLILRERLEAALGTELQIEVVITRTDIDWSQIATDLVLTTISPGPFAHNVVTIQPFLTTADIERVRLAIARVRQHRRRARLKEELLLFFDSTLFLRDFHAADEEAMIRALGERMVGAGIIQPSYIDGAIERELISSTAFTDSIAVPHALAMTAERTAICIVINHKPMRWGDNNVNVIALIAFSASGRTTFQTVFDQFVSVFADRDDVQRLIDRAVDFPAFIEELVHGIDR